MSLNIIGGINGNYQALKRLLAKMPSGAVLATGNLIGDGHQSRQVMDIFMAQPDRRYMSVLGCNEWRLLEFAQTKSRETFLRWYHNGGMAMMGEFDIKDGNLLIPDAYTDFLWGLPPYHMEHDLLVTHAPIVQTRDGGKVLAPYLKDCASQLDYLHACEDFLWADKPPENLGTRYQVFGHAGQAEAYVDRSGLAYATCIDSSLGGIMTGMHWPTQMLYHEIL